MQSEIKLPFGLREGKLIHISQVETGLKCNCICPRCGVELVAKNNPENEKTEHFAHYRSKNCTGALERAIHLMAKQVIKNKLEITTPKFFKKAPKQTDTSNELHYGNEVNIPSRNLPLDQIDLEVSKDGFKPDVVASIKDRILNIEIKVTHEVDEEKRRRVKSLKEPMFEIDLSDLEEETLRYMENFEYEVLHNPNNRHWIYNPKGEALYEIHLKALHEKVNKVNKKANLREKQKKERDKRFKKLKWQKRKHHLEDLNKLEQADSQKWREKRNKRLNKKYGSFISNQLTKIGYNNSDKLDIFDKNVGGSWIFEAPQRAWQVTIFAEFIHEKPLNTKIRANEVKKYIVNEFGVIGFMKRLNNVKQKQKNLGPEIYQWIDKNGCWFFNPIENSKIISPFKPIIQYLNYLNDLMIITLVNDKSYLFQIEHNTWNDYLSFIQELGRGKITLAQKELEKRKSLQQNVRDIQVDYHKDLLSKRINNIIKSEHRILNLYGSNGRRCLSCHMCSHVNDGERCPFCGHSHFKELTISGEHLKVAKHKYASNSRIDDAVKNAPSIDLSILKDDL